MEELAALRTEREAFSSSRQAEIERMLDTFGQVPHYANKVQVLQLRMREITSKMERTKRRTAKLQQKRTGDDLSVADKQESVAVKERMLLAKPSAELIQSGTNEKSS